LSPSQALFRVLLLKRDRSVRMEAVVLAMAALSAVAPRAAVPMDGVETLNSSAELVAKLDLETATLAPDLEAMETATEMAMETVTVMVTAMEMETEA